MQQLHAICLYLVWAFYYYLLCFCCLILFIFSILLNTRLMIFHWGQYYTWLGLDWSRAIKICDFTRLINHDFSFMLIWVVGIKIYADYYHIITLYEMMLASINPVLYLYDYAFWSLSLLRLLISFWRWFHLLYVLLCLWLIVLLNLQASCVRWPFS